MVRPTSASAPAKKLSVNVATKTLVLDNGSHTIKAGFSAPGVEPDLKDCHVIPNCIARSQRDKRTYIAAELDECIDFGELQIRRPVERGYIVNWEGEKAIWDRTILDSQSPVHCDPSECNLLLTEAPNAPSAVQRNSDEMVFEEYEFASLYRTTAPMLNAYTQSPFASTSLLPAGSSQECLLVVDIGHSHTTVTPLYQGHPLHPACRRLEIGGRLLTNLLKERLSRTMDMQREEWIVQEMKEDTCYVAADLGDFSDRLERAWKGGQKDPREVDASVLVDYVLPDYEQLKRGYAKPYDVNKTARMRLGIGGAAEPAITVGNERFTVPELLFAPSDIGMQQDGIPGVILQSLDALPKGLWQPLLASILVVGGTSKMPGLVERLERELRNKIDDSYSVRVVRAEDPTKNVWLGGARLAQDSELLRSLSVTRAEYIEHGELWTRRKFAGKVHR
ncbi:actin-related protein, ARP6 class [Dissoconium aciculare CBS 342.82]|uniref:Actin-like protein ARP6 n=1 Tax=Dissoconium aciculare CBS 342.82 TaxID=1314786 RepID=A0A6J3M232_9PEZI|nr:actin-related protein, ARP6 class [Dissoconium aciculare CBS 342.82]KAF1820982.1 actin-related protein, ARP6 class [Dissoconium aciculare CBS 342.82]